MKPSRRAALKAALASAAVLLAPGCVTVGKRFVPIQGVSGQAIVYLYRESGVIGHGLDLEIQANGKSVAMLQVGTYEALNMDPGEYRFTAEPHRRQQIVMSGIEARGIHGNTLLTLDVVAGQVYYLRLAEGLGSLLIDAVPGNEAQPELDRLRPAVR